MLPSTAFATASATTSHVGPATSSPSSAEGEDGDERDLQYGHEREREPVSGEQVEPDKRHGHQPLECPRRALAQHRDRCDEEHGDERKEAEERCADVLKDGRAVRTAAARRNSSTHGTPTMSTTVRGSRRSCEAPASATAKVTRPLTRPLHEPEERAVEVVDAGPRPQLGRRRLREQPSLTEQKDGVAAVRLVHHVARYEQRHAALGEPVEQLPEIAAQHRIEADRRLVQHQQVGRAEQRRGQRHAGALSAGEPVRQPDRGTRASDTSARTVQPLSIGTASTRAKKARFSCTLRSP